MEARIFRAALIAAVLVVSMGAGHRTPNFVIQTQDPEMAKKIGQAAEKYRRELAVTWLGEAMPDWSHPCPMTVRVGPHLGAGGATTFVFDRGEVFGWRMSIQGSVERLFDSVLPHEITHMVFASHFRQPLPRWADEGGATTVEHPSERMKHRRMLVFFLKSGRGIAFGNMFRMTEYPRDIMPLYAQGYSLAEFLIQKGGQRKYIDFVGDGLKTNQWSAAIQRHYGIRTLGSLQNTWLAWVKQGSPAQQPESEPSRGLPQPETVALAEKLPRPEPNLLYHYTSESSGASTQARTEENPAVRPANVSGDTTRPAQQALVGTVSSPGASSHDGWRPTNTNETAPVPRSIASDPRPAPLHTQSAHPRPFEQPRQTILEWGSQ